MFALILCGHIVYKLVYLGYHPNMASFFVVPIPDQVKIYTSVLLNWTDWTSSWECPSEEECDFWAQLWSLVISPRICQPEPVAFTPEHISSLNNILRSLINSYIRQFVREVFLILWHPNSYTVWKTIARK